MFGFRFDYPSRIPVFFKGNFNYNGFRYNTLNTSSFFEDLKPAYITEDEINFRFDAGIPYRVNGVLKSGLGIGRNREIYYMTRDFSSTDTSDVSSINSISFYVAGERYTLNNKQFATEGTHRIHSIRVGYGAESYVPGSTSDRYLHERLSYLWLSARMENSGYIPLGSSFSLGYYLRAQLTFKPLLSNYFSTIIDAPAFQPNMVTKGLFMEHYRANQFIATGLMPVYALNSRIHLKGEVYAFFPVQEILRDANNEAYLGHYFKRMNTMFHASLNLVTVAGPVSFHVGYITEDENPWLYQISFGYLLFNKKVSDE